MEKMIIQDWVAGAINIIKCIEEGFQYTNKEVRYKVGHAEIVPVD